MDTNRPIADKKRARPKDDTTRARKKVASELMAFEFESLSLSSSNGGSTNRVDFDDAADSPSSPQRHPSVQRQVAHSLRESQAQQDQELPKYSAPSTTSSATTTSPATTTRTAAPITVASASESCNELADSSWSCSAWQVDRVQARRVKSKCSRIIIVVVIILVIQCKLFFSPLRSANRETATTLYHATTFTLTVILFAPFATNVAPTITPTYYDGYLYGHG
ncbi:hypothetical protein EC957_003733 [Mortierella hygrophila]|uniref:Uncharacterized protein n=1 Tax=Mortierella hygrophila TaxID=979708 RepID=A0A9P6F2F8_9FUNG|nr:hypothetical protein EC957_003733 [Mortierella hygrophila]